MVTRKLIALPGLFALVAACADAEPVPQTPPPPPPAPAPAAATPAAVSPAVSSDPTALSDAQRARDAARVPLASAIVNAYPNWGGFFSSLAANFSPDGKKIVFASTRDGLPEIYEGDATNVTAPPRAVTTGPERAIWADYTPDGKAILFLRDGKGDENHHIWRVGADGSGLTDLTPGEPLHRGEPLFPRKKPGFMFYDARRTTDIRSMLFSQPIGGGEPRLVFTNERPGGLADVSPDGSRALYADVASSDDRAILEVDVASGKARRIYPAAGKKEGSAASRTLPTACASSSRPTRGASLRCCSRSTRRAARRLPATSTNLRRSRPWSSPSRRPAIGSPSAWTRATTARSACSMRAR